MKRNEKNLMMANILFVVAVVISNVVGSRVMTTGISLGGIEIYCGGALFAYPITFLCTDIIGEIWGKHEANKAVLRGFTGQLFALALIILTGLLPARDAAMAEAYDKLLGQNFIFCTASMVAYLASQTWDVWVFHKIRDRDIRHKWVRNNLSTMTSQIIDTFIYTFLAFGIGLRLLWSQGGFVDLIGLLIGQYVLKCLFAALDTPFFYLFTKNSNKQ